MSQILDRLRLCANGLTGIVGLYQEGLGGCDNLLIAETASALTCPPRDLLSFSDGCLPRPLVEGTHTRMLDRQGVWQFPSDGPCGFAAKCDLRRPSIWWTIVQADNTKLRLRGAITTERGSVVIAGRKPVASDRLLQRFVRPLASLPREHSERTRSLAA